ncbi:MAG: rod shape-determining protein MreD [Paracoccaceae bacterium]|jgi:rod shape-determining protein MreD|nr:rod shape-determining protein MreD [Paracoccaceae bacterium]
MAERYRTHLWAMRLLYAALCSLVMMFHLLPLGQLATVSFTPDVILCLTLAWVIRRPEYAPILLIAIVALLADLLLMRVPGLWAALVVLLANSIGKKRRRMRSTGFAVEWFRVSSGIAVIFVVQRIALSLLFVEPAPIIANLAQFIATIAAYPLIVALTAGVLRIRKPDLIEAEAGGRA